VLVTSLVYYVSGHGFGHAVRSAEIIRALLRSRPDLEVLVRTSAPAWLFPDSVQHQPAELDVGVVQSDALQVDPAATLASAAALARHADQLVEAEAAVLQATRASLVVGDVPPLAFLAAARAGVPSVAVANFSWDWIYAPYVRQLPSYSWLLNWLRRAYGQARLLLRLPFYGDLAAFPGIEDVPLVSRPTSAPRKLLRARFGIDQDQRVVLLSFGGLGLGGFDPQPLAEHRDYLFLATEKEVGSGELPPNLRLLAAQQENYSDLIAACDAVVTKPGFGIVANCLALRVPLLYTDRGDFAEYPVLVEAVQRLGRGRYLPQADLRAARLGRHLAELLRQDQPWADLRTDGAEVIAGRLLEEADRSVGQS
jgi:hypothetical protein